MAHNASSLTARRFAAFYALAALLIILRLLTTVDTLYSPHEWQHFMRGLTFSTLYKDQTMPTSIYQFVELARNKENPDKLAWVPLNRDAAELALKPDERDLFMSAANVSRYPVTCYIPHIIGGTLGDWLELRPAAIYYIVRVLCLLSGLGIGYIILRLLPCMHLPAMIILLLPSTWMMRSNQYPDYVVNVMALLFIAVLVRLLFLQPRIHAGYVALLAGSAIVLSISKLVYFPLTLAALLLTPRYFPSMRHYVLCMACVIGASGAFSLLSLAEAFEENYHIDLHAELSGGGQGAQSDRQQALAAIKADPVGMVKQVFTIYASETFLKEETVNLFMRGYFFNRSHYVYELFGVWLLLTVWPLLFAVVPRARNMVSAGGRLWLFAICGLTVIAVTLALFIDEIGLNMAQVGTVQGRYFVPLLPVVMLMCSVALPELWVRRLVAVQAVFALTVMAIMYGIIV